MSDRARTVLDAWTGGGNTIFALDHFADGRVLLGTLSLSFGLVTTWFAVMDARRSPTSTEGRTDS